jgi:hypothetical protein
MNPIQLGKLGYILGFIPALYITSLILGVINQPILNVFGFSFSDITAFLSLLFTIDTGFAILVFYLILKHTDLVVFK